MSPSTAVSRAPVAFERLPASRAVLPHPIAARMRTNGSVCFRVLGASMFPWIRSGDLVFARRYPFETISPGSMVLFERDARLFVHRMLRREPSEANGRKGSALITKGDTLDQEDAPVSHGEYLGRVIRIHRGKRHIDLESFGWLMLARLLARFSPASSLFYGPLRAVKHLVLG